MSRLEVRVQEACREAADTVRPEVIRSLDLEPDQRPARTRQAAATHRRGRVLGPLAAAAAVAIVVAGVVVLPRLMGGTPGHPSRQTHTSTPKPNALAALPKFTVLNNTNAIDVVTTATGRIVGQLHAPARQGFAALAGTASDRTFFAVADLNPQTSCQSFFYRFTLSADGRPSALIPLPVRRLPGLPTALAADASGNLVAFSIDQCATGASGHIGNGQAIGNIGLFDLTAGRTIRRWTYTLGEDYTTDLSISADGRLLGYSNFLDAKYMVGRVIPTSAPSGPDERYSHIVTRRPMLTALSTSGRLMYAISGTRDLALAAYSTANGQQVKVLRRLPASTETGVLVVDPTGRSALLSMTHFSTHKRLYPYVKGRPCLALRVHGILKCERITPPQTHFVIIDLTTGKVTALPFRQHGPPSWGVVAW